MRFFIPVDHLSAVPFHYKKSQANSINSTVHNSPVMYPVHAFPIQFIFCIVALCPIYNDLTVFTTDTYIFKCLAADQAAAEATQDILQSSRIHIFQVTVDDFPVRKAAVCSSISYIILDTAIILSVPIPCALRYSSIAVTVF